uniref:Uncharacterized protein n=1 Tax=Sinocyclocheilus grahami TaxID=75366 RepID=A0A672RLD1_SINGR
ALGYEQGSIDRKPVPAKALFRMDPINSLEYSWQLVGVLQYSQEKKEYLVHKADCNGWVWDSDGKPILNGGQREDMFNSHSRTLVILYTEDPRVFAQRIQFAQDLRQYTDGTPTLDPTSLERIRNYAVSTPEEELHLEYIRTMNQMCFDKVVQENPDEFLHITLPRKEPEKVPEKESWLNALCTEISSSLHGSRDWYNLSLSNWHVYHV